MPVEPLFAGCGLTCGPLDYSGSYKLIFYEFITLIIATSMRIEVQCISSGCAVVSGCTDFTIVEYSLAELAMPAGYCLMLSSHVCTSSVM